MPSDRSDVVEALQDTVGHLRDRLGAYEALAGAVHETEVDLRATAEEMRQHGRDQEASVVEVHAYSLRTALARLDREDGDD